MKKFRRTNRRNRAVVGIDEVGRGALAGPVTVAVVALEREAQSVRRKALGKLRDSKRLSAKKREAWFAHFKSLPGLHYVVARVYPRQIEKRNISRAANLAAYRALIRLREKRKVKSAKFRIYLDGGLYLKDKGTSAELGAKTVVRGDERIAVVAVASIIAKVSRDRFMARLAKRHSGYGFELHKGYGTRAHFAAIRRLGPTPAHRRTFLV
jgi:ribonuclease HII